MARTSLSDITVNRVQFAFDFDKTHAGVVYLASKSLPAFDKFKLCKLLFLADKLHLVRYGRPITGDHYAALEHGPVPSEILNLLNHVEQQDSQTNSRVRALAESLELDRSFEHPRLRARQTPDMGVLSKSDVDVLERVAETHGSKTFAELRALTHEMVAYQRAWARRRAKKSVPMAFEDFFEEDADAIAGAREEMFENDALRRSFPAR